MFLVPDWAGQAKIKVMRFNSLHKYQGRCVVGSKHLLIQMFDSFIIILSIVA
jgi:hypothetical protein